MGEHVDEGRLVARAAELGLTLQFCDEWPPNGLGRRALAVPRRITWSKDEDRVTVECRGAVQSFTVERRTEAAVYYRPDTEGYTASSLASKLMGFVERFADGFVALYRHCRLEGPPHAAFVTDVAVGEHELYRYTYGFDEDAALVVGVAAPGGGPIRLDHPQSIAHSYGASRDPLLFTVTYLYDPAEFTRDLE